MIELLLNKKTQAWIVLFVKSTFRSTTSTTPHYCLKILKEALKQDQETADVLKWLVKCGFLLPPVERDESETEGEPVTKIYLYYCPSPSKSAVDGIQKTTITVKTPKDGKKEVFFGDQETLEMAFERFRQRLTGCEGVRGFCQQNDHQVSMEKVCPQRKVNTKKTLLQPTPRAKDSRAKSTNK